MIYILKIFNLAQIKSMNRFMGRWIKPLITFVAFTIAIWTWKSYKNHCIIFNCMLKSWYGIFFKNRKRKLRCQESLKNDFTDVEIEMVICVLSAALNILRHFIPLFHKIWFLFSLGVMWYCAKLVVNVRTLVISHKSRTNGSFKWIIDLLNTYEIVQVFLARIDFFVFQHL